MENLVEKLFYIVAYTLYFINNTDEIRNWLPIIAFGSAIIAYFSYRQSIKSNRQRATLELIEKAESTEFYRRNAEVFRSYRDKDTLLKLAGSIKQNTPPKKWKLVSQDKAAVKDYLNHYELVALGIKKGFLDEHTYKKWTRSSYRRTYYSSRDFIQRSRWKLDANKQKYLYNAKIYQNFENLALKWASPRSKVRHLLGEKLNSHLTREDGLRPEAPKPLPTNAP